MSALDPTPPEASEASEATLAPEATTPPSAPSPSPPVSPAPAPPSGPSFFARLFRLPATIGWRDHVIGFALASTYVTWLMATARSLGFPRDEGFYFRAARDYARWFELLLANPHAATVQSAIDGSWGDNHEHPSLVKSLFAISWLTLHEKWHVFKDASDAFRLPGMAMAGLALWITYVFGARVYERRAGLIGAVVLALMPRVFFNAHLACFDVPIMTMWTWCVYVYWRSLRGGLVWAIAAGVMYGLTLDTKHNAWIMPALFIPHALFVQAGDFGRQLRRGRLSLPLPLVAMATIGPLVFYALWPWIWNDTLPRVQEWVNFHTHHDYYNMEFLGKNYYDAPSPRSYAPVMILATVPTVTIGLFAVGAYDRIRAGLGRLWAWFKRRPSPSPPARAGLGVALGRDPSETDLLLGLSFAAPIAPFVLLSATPIFGGTKHWFPAYPVLAIIAGRGFCLVADAMNRAWPAWSEPKKRLAEAALVLSVTIAPLAETIHSHPFGLSAYVPFAGGTAGGADLGLNRQFWGFTTESVGPWFAANVKRPTTVFPHDTAWDSWQEMITEGRLPANLRGAPSAADAEYALVQHELHMNEIDYAIWAAYGTDAPVYVLTHDGVPIVSVYKRP